MSETLNDPNSTFGIMNITDLLSSFTKITIADMERERLEPHTQSNLLLFQNSNFWKNFLFSSSEHLPTLITSLRMLQTELGLRTSGSLHLIDFDLHSQSTDAFSGPPESKKDFLVDDKKSNQSDNVSIRIIGPQQAKLQSTTTRTAHCSLPTTKPEPLEPPVYTARSKRPRNVPEEQNWNVDLAPMFNPSASSPTIIAELYDQDTNESEAQLCIDRSIGNHKGDKRLAPSLVSNATATQSAKRRRLVEHKGIVCPECNQTFRLESSLNNHISVVHCVEKICMC